MIKFGNENDDMNSAPFLFKTIEEMDNEVKFIVALSIKGKQGCGINEEDNPALGKILSECVPIYPDEDNLYEILFDNYIFHITRNESYTSWDNYELRKGKYFIIFEKSRLLDCLPQIVEQEIVEAYNPNSWKHYGIYCQNHIIDIIASEEPKIRKYSL